MFTTGNMACGFSAILLAFADEFRWAAALLAGSIVLDIADGAVARLVGATSPFGVQLDSLADLVSFGLAPAVLVHTWALPENPVVAWLSAFFWLACAAFRLARFNVTVDPLADKKYFVGLPSPGATLVVIATILALRTPEHGPGMFVPVGVSIVPALLMVTTVRFRSFRGLLSPRTSQARATTAVLAVALVVGLVLDPATTGLVVACAYLLTAPLGVSRRRCGRGCSGRRRSRPRGIGCSRCSCRSPGTRTEADGLRGPSAVLIGHGQRSGSVCPVGDLTPVT